MYILTLTGEQIEGSDHRHNIQWMRYIEIKNKFLSQLADFLFLGRGPYISNHVLIYIIYIKFLVAFSRSMFCCCFLYNPMFLSYLMSKSVLSLSLNFSKGVNNISLEECFNYKNVKVQVQLFDDFKKYPSHAGYPLYGH